MRQIQAFLFYLLVFLIPVHFFKVIDPNTGYIHGLLIDYLIIKVHILDCTAVAFIFLSLLLNKVQIQKKIHLSNLFQTPLVLIVLLMLFTVFFTGQQLVGLLHLLRIGMAFTVFFLARSTGLLQARKPLVTALAALIYFQSFLALYQFCFQRELWGYILLGEPDLQAYGVTTGQMSGVEMILPYGTTAHPNILAGMLSISMLVVLYLEYKRKNNFYELSPLILLPLLSGTVVLFLTQSISGITSFFVGLTTLLLSHRKKFLSFVPLHIFMGYLILVSCAVAVLLFVCKYQTAEVSVVRRARLQEAALVLMGNRFLTGVGASQFTAELENFAYSQEIVRFVQPVHMWLLLFVSEYGLLGIALVGSVSYRYRHRSFFAPLLVASIPLAVLDHYLLSMENGLFLTALLFAVSLKGEEE